MRKKLLVLLISKSGFTFGLYFGTLALEDALHQRFNLFGKSIGNMSGRAARMCPLSGARPMQRSDNVGVVVTRSHSGNGAYIV